MCLRTRSGTPGRLGVTPSRAPVVVVRHVVEPGHVDAATGREPHQHAVAASRTPLGLPLADHLGDREHDLLAVAEDDGVHEVRDRLGVERGVAAGEHDRVVLGAVDRMQRDAGKVERREHVGVAELGGEGEPEDVEAAHRAVAVDGELRDAVLAHHRLHVGPDRVGALGEHAVALVEDLVEDLHALVGQPHLVGVGVHQRPPDLGLAPRPWRRSSARRRRTGSASAPRQMRLERGEDGLTRWDGHA